MQCRACLKIDSQNTTKLDEHYVKCFNLLTNLNIHLGDTMPQQLCGNCLRDLECCIVFREKCITANSILIESEFIFNKKLNLNHIKEEDIQYDHEIGCDEKIDIKKEVIDKFEEEHHSHVNLDQFDDNFEYEYIEDTKLPSNINENPVKPTRRKKIKEKPCKDICNYDCGLCSEKCEKEKLLEHVNSHESSNFCRICSKTFTEWSMLLVHRVNHLPKTKLLCHICFKYFQLPISLEFHYNVKHLGKNQKSVLKCLECNKSYRSVQSLHKHKWSVHSSSTYICNDCSKEFRNKAMLKYHIQSLHTKKRMLFCGQCDYTSSFPSNLKQHQIRKHTSEKVYCKLCTGVFENDSKHEKHKCSERKSIICPICGIVLDRHSRLNRHLQTHTTERKYKCDRCPATYKSKMALQAHTDKHDGVRTRKCEHCPAAFYEFSALIRHRRIHTGEKPYVCKICQKGFNSNHNLKVHMRVHGENLIKKRSNNLEEDPDNVHKLFKTTPQKL